MIFSILLRTLFPITLALASGLSFAHGYSAGDIRIQHPFATPTPPGVTIGAGYFVKIENMGTQDDRLMRASTPAAARVELHSGDIGADGVMRMRELDQGLLIPAKAIIKPRPGTGDHLMLIDLKEPLVEGDTFPMTLEFEHAGKVDVKVTVLTPRDRRKAPKMDPGKDDEHKH